MDNPLTVKQLAERWTVHPQTIREQIREGKVASFKVGGRARVTMEEVRRIELNKKTVTATQSVADRIREKYRDARPN